MPSISIRNHAPTLIWLLFQVRSQAQLRADAAADGRTQNRLPSALTKMEEVLSTSFLLGVALYGYQLLLGALPSPASVSYSSTKHF
eukprot:SAG31_NODE_18751_length_624_cov_0.807619_1_plen_85_part_10